MTVTKTKYSDVYKDENGKFFYQVFLLKVRKKFGQRQLLFG